MKSSTTTSNLTKEAIKPKKRATAKAAKLKAEKKKALVAKKPKRKSVTPPSKLKTATKASPAGLSSNNEDTHYSDFDKPRKAFFSMIKQQRLQRIKRR